MKSTWALALLALAAGPAAAQVIVGGGARPSVEVDLGAIHGGGGAPMTSAPVPGYDRPLLNPPVEAPKLRPPRAKAERPAPARKPTAKAAVSEPKPAAQPSPQPKLAAPAPPPPPPAIASAAPPPPVVAAPAAPPPFPPAANEQVGAIASAPIPPPAAPQAFQQPQPFSAGTGPAPQPFAAAPPQALAPPARPAPAATPAPAAPAPQPPRPTQMASLPPAGGDLSVEFQGDSADLSAAAAARLRSLATSLKGKGARIQLKAYASGGQDGPSRAKRVSLSRALSVRSFLIGEGMSTTQIDVRALGQVRDGGPEDRVDVTVTGQ